MTLFDVLFIAVGAWFVTLIVTAMVNSARHDLRIRGVKGRGGMVRDGRQRPRLPSRLVPLAARQESTRYV